MRLARDVVRDVARTQHGLLTRAQCLALGGDASWIRRQVASGAWQPVQRGVFVVHSGPISWAARAHAAVLYAGPGAALSHAAAAFVHGFDTAPRVIDVTVPATRAVRAGADMRVHRRRALVVITGPLPVVSRADALLDRMAATTGDDDAVALVCAAIRSGTRPADVLTALGRRRGSRGGALVRELLAAVDEGVESPLERRYRRDVEGRHGLPTSALQVRQRIRGRWIRADALYEGLGVRIELDGEVAHPGGRTSSDAWRDNDVLIDRGDLTLRYRWPHVRGNPCATAAQVIAALRSRGWPGVPTPCGPTCPLP